MSLFPATTDPTTDGTLVPACALTHLPLHPDEPVLTLTRLPGGNITIRTSSRLNRRVDNTVQVSRRAFDQVALNLNEPYVIAQKALSKGEVNRARQNLLYALLARGTDLHAAPFFTRPLTRASLRLIWLLECARQEQMYRTVISRLGPGASDEEQGA